MIAQPNKNTILNVNEKLKLNHDYWKNKNQTFRPIRKYVLTE